MSQIQLSKRDPLAKMILFIGAEKMTGKGTFCKERCHNIGFMFISAISLKGGSMLTYQYSEDILCAGQPAESDLNDLKNQGYRSIVNLRPQHEPGQIPQAADKATQLGFDYHHLPIGGPGDLNEENVTRFDALLKDVSMPTLIHCGSSNRVGALFALRAAYVNRKDEVEALQEGRKAGLTALEPVVRQILGL